ADLLSRLYLAKRFDSQVDLHRLAEEACLSPYHFHRIYTVIVGETIAKTIRRLRLQRAGADLLSSDTEISFVAKASGYSCVPSFCRAFRNEYGVAPATYRKKGGLSTDPQYSKKTQYQVKIENILSIPVIALSHKGEYCDITYSFERLINWALGNRKIECKSKVFSIIYDDPALITSSKLNSDACISVSKSQIAEKPYYETEISGGYYAVVTIYGPFHEVESVFDWLLKSWLPSTNKELSERPCFVEHIGNPRTTVSAQLCSRVHVPLKQYD
ncbi:MAG: GyrI-like domain-containing protein, partial [Methylococcales bacterium]|nr:GyrI-like domain-containing protein [Methylococcales bacterium]